MLYLMVRSLPRFEESVSDKRSRFERYLSSGIPERFDSVIRAIMLRFLRRVKVLVLRLDNSITRQLTRIKEAKTTAAFSFEHIEKEKAEEPAQ